MNCGGAIEGDSLAACASCGKVSQPALSGAEMTRMIKEASSDALGAIRRVAVDPIAGLASSFAVLGEQRARSAGIAFGVGFALVAALASFVAASKLTTGGNFKLIVAVFISALVPFVAIAAVSAATRKVVRAAGTIGADLFVAGVALQPLGLLLILAAILGLDNYQAVAILGLFAWTYMLCILFAGSTKLVGVPERFAPPAIAVMLLAAMWLTKIVATVLFDAGSPLGRFFG
jgi:hypothetical protein